MFKDRLEAARQLSKEIFTRIGGELDLNNTIVLGMPRGGVPIAAVIAKDLTIPLNIIISKKIGHPNNSEYAIGAVTELGDEIYSDDASSLGQVYLAKTKQETLDKIDGYKSRLRPGNLTFPELKDKTVILVDDGIVTGQSIAAAITSLKKQEVGRLIVATPLSSRESAEIISQVTDNFICLKKPPFFLALGRFYENFDQVSEDEVKKLLLENNN